MKTIKMGYRGKETCELCRQLLRLGFPVTESDIFTTKLQQMVILFQKVYGLDIDGIVGYRSWETLFFASRRNGEKLTEEDFTLVSKLLDVEIAVLKAVQKVETGGRGGFFSPGKPAILFEGHIFWSQLKKRNIVPENYIVGNEHILYPKWEKCHYKGGLGEYERLEQARKINKAAADASASWGMFQIMGFNYAACGEISIESFVKSMIDSECKQLILFARFIKQSGMLPALQFKNWAEFAKRYNGPAYALNKYDEKLADAYKLYSMPL